MKIVKEQWRFISRSSFTTPIILINIFFIAFFLRIYLIPSNLFFGPEQGRDFLVIREIVINNNLTLIGSKTDVEGVFHGPFFYYLVSVPFLASGGNPVFISSFLIVINSLSVFFIYLLGKEIFGKKEGILSAFIFSISYEAIMYSRWLSNPPLSIPFACLFFLFLQKFLKGKDINLLYTSLVFGILVQIQFLNLVFFSLITFVFVLVNYKRFRNLSMIYKVLPIGILIGVSIGSYILFDIRHNFLIIGSLINLVSGNSGYYTSYLSSIISTVNTFFQVFLDTIGLVNSIYSVMLLILAIGYLLILVISRKTKTNSLLVLVWLLIPALVLAFFRHSVLEHYFIPLIPGFILLAAFVINKIWRYSFVIGFFLLMLIVGSNVIKWVENIPKNENISFQSTQLGLKLSDQIYVVDEIYKAANRESFSFQSYTIPYWSQQGWEYLFWYYGEKKYGYAPIPEKAKVLFVIIQDDPSNKKFQQSWLNNTVSKWGKYKSSFIHGVLTVRQLDV